MPYETAVLPAYRLGLVRLDGVVTGDAIADALCPLYRSEKWTPGYDTIWDLRAVSQVIVSPAQAVGVVERVRALEERMGGGHTAVVVRNASQHEVANMLIHMAGTGCRERKAFYTLGEAVSWILTAASPVASGGGSFREERALRGGGFLQGVARFLSQWGKN